MTGRRVKIDAMAENTAPPFYQIRIRGVLGEALMHAFPQLTGVQDGSDTVLSGELADQAALYGVISQIESLGLELLEIHPATRA